MRGDPDPPGAVRKALGSVTGRLLHATVTALSQKFLFRLQPLAFVPGQRRVVEVTIALSPPSAQIWTCRPRLQHPAPGQSRFEDSNREQGRIQFGQQP